MRLLVLRFVWFFQIRKPVSFHPVFHPNSFHIATILDAYLFGYFHDIATSGLVFTYPHFPFPKCSATPILRNGVNSYSLFYILHTWILARLPSISRGLDREFYGHSMWEAADQLDARTLRSRGVEPQHPCRLRTHARATRTHFIGVGFYNNLLPVTSVTYAALMAFWSQ